MLKKLDIKIVLLVIVTAVVVIVSYIFNSKEKLEESEKYIVTNYSNFYTVDSCLYRFSTYLSEKNIEILSNYQTYLLTVKFLNVETTINSYILDIYK